MYGQSVCGFVVALAGALGCAPRASIGLIGLNGAAQADGTAVGFPQFPSLSPDGSTVVFAWAGDLWAVPTEGGLASRLTAHAAEEGRSAFSPDGGTLALESDRDGAQNLYTMPLVALNGGFAGGALTRVTTSDRSHALAGFSPDGEALMFSSRAEPSVYRHARMYRAPLDGGPVQRMTDAFGMDPSGRDGAVVFTRGYAIWDRPRYRGSGSMDLYLMDADGAFTRLTSFEGNDGAGHLLPDGSVVFVSSRDGQNNVWRLEAGATDADGGALTQLTFFATGELASIGHGVRDLAVSADGSTAVFCVWDAMYTLDLTRAGAEPVELEVRASADSDQLDTQWEELDRSVTSAALSPDGKTVAVVARGELFVRALDEGRPTRRVTESVWREEDIAWSPDGRWLYFTSDRDGTVSIYRASVDIAAPDLRPEETEPQEEPDEQDEPEDPHEPQDPDEAGGEPEEPGEEGEQPEEGEGEAGDEEKDDEPKKPDHGARWAEAITFAIEPVLVTGFNDHSPKCSPDGRTLLFVRSRGDLMVMDLASGEIRPIFEGWNEPDVQWAGDSRHIVYEVADLDFNSDIWLLDTGAEGGAPVNLTRHPDIDRSPRLSADGRVLYFVSDRSGENSEYDVYRVYLDRSLEAMESYELAEHFEERAASAKKRKPVDPEAGEAPAPLEFDAEDAYLRIERITSHPGSEGDLAVTPGGERVIFSGNVDGSRGLYSVDYRGDELESLQSGGVSDVTVSLKGDKVLMVRSGEPSTVSPTGGKTTAHPIEARILIDVEAQQRQKFLEAARLLGEGFYHPTLKGLDWEALTERYLSLAIRTRTSSEFNRVGNMLFGELEGSHLAMRGGGSYSAPSPATGYLGIEHEPAEDGYRVTRVVPHGPAAADGVELRPGDVITGVDGRALRTEPGLRDLDAALVGAAGRQTLLSVKRADPGGSGHVLITPLGYGAWNTLAYEDEVRRRAEEVDRLSGGRLGYLHIRGMNQASVRVFERDLYAAANGKDGLIIDVRDNGGGSTTDVLLSSLTAPNHAYTVPRGADPDEVPHDAYPRDRRLIYGYTRPISVICNQHSFSNAEIFSHAIKTIGRGTLVGETTFGGVISTGARRLIDGTLVRMPFRGWYLPDGTDMENNGAVPDLRVPQRPEDEAAGRDPQLGAAVEELLTRIDE